MARSRRSQAPTPQRLILDSGAVIALSRNDLRARATLAVGQVSSADERTARAAARAARSTSTVDALVVASAIGIGGGVVLTGDPDDLEPLADGHPEVVIRVL